MKKIAITTGDTNGIGTEVLIKALNRLSDAEKKRIILVTAPEILDFWQGKLNLRLDFDYKIEKIPFEGEVEIAKDTAVSGDFSFNCLKKASETAKRGEVGAIVTCPVSKNALNLAGHKFLGQTEVLEQFLARDGQKTEMLFVAGDFRVMLLTRHIPLSAVSGMLSVEIIEEKIERLALTLETKFKINNPKTALCSLNPHAGEDGLLGREEIDVLIPAVDKLQKKGYNITMPKPSDTLFAKAAKEIQNGQKPGYDCYVALYHDQGLIPLKLLAFDSAVNTTIGLDIIRTSPAHGTGFDIAGENRANENSMLEAIKLALSLY